MMPLQYKMTDFILFFYDFNTSLPGVQINIKAAAEGQQKKKKKKTTSGCVCVSMCECVYANIHDLIHCM